MPLYKRVIDVRVGGRLFSNNLRITFDIVKTGQSTCNSASINIYNMADNSRNEIKELDDDIEVRAGYEEHGGTKLVFIGNILRVNHSYSLPDVVTKIEAGDGIKVLRDQRQSVSFEEGTEVATVLKEVSSNLGVDIRELPKDITGQYLNGFSHVGSVQNALNKICDRIQCGWSIQDGQLQVIKDNGASVHAPVKITLVEGLLERLEKLGDARQFLIDTDLPTQAGYKFRTLLNPDIQPGRIVTLTDYAGKYRVERVQHTGDNYEGDFVSIVEVKELNSNE